MGHFPEGEQTSHRTILPIGALIEAKLGAQFFPKWSREPLSSQEYEQQSHSIDLLYTEHGGRLTSSRKCDQEPILLCSV